MMNVMDPGWLRTDLGGPNAPNSVESVIPGALVGALLDDQKVAVGLMLKIMWPFNRRSFIKSKNK